VKLYNRYLQPHISDQLFAMKFVAFLRRATKSTPAFVGSPTAANSRVFWLSGLLTADVGRVDCKLSGCLVVGPVDGRCRVRQWQIVWLSGCRACRRQMSGPSTANCLVVWLSGLLAADVGPVNGKLSGCLVVGPVDGRCRARRRQIVWLSGLSTADVGLSSQLN
jgi:hypothetical protein